MSFPVKMWSGLVEEKHFKAMGITIWLYLWMVVRITKEIEGKGYILGGKPIKDKEIIEDLGVSRRTIVDWRERLQKTAYLESYKTPYGMVYFVNKSKKFKWGRKKPAQSNAETCTNKLRYKEDIKDIKHRRTFSVPSLKDISEYCAERNNGVDPQRFHDFYQSKGWYVGKNKMKDWKAAVRTWERKDDKKKIRYV